MKWRLLAIFLGIASASFLPSLEFEDFQSIYGRLYSSESERALRSVVFHKNLDLLSLHNSNPNRSFSMSINKFSDRTRGELYSLEMLASPCSSPSFNLSVKTEGMPLAFDWRSSGVVTPVRNQGNCGASWAMAAVGALESHWAILNNSTPPVLSPQQLIDCSGGFLNNGCTGGLPSQAFEFIEYANGITSEAQYPYTGSQHTCWTNVTMEAQNLGGSVNITALNELGLQQAVCYDGPVAIVFYVAEDFYQYSSGVYSNPNCQSTSAHAGLVVGYGNNTAGIPYWIVKNSWGSDWGEAGYFNILRGNNTCGLATCAAYPNVGGY